MTQSRTILFDRPAVLSAFRRLLPRAVQNELQRSRVVLNTLVHARGVYHRDCPICGYAGRFDAAGDPPRYDARCRGCGSLERHRLLKLWLDRENTSSLGRLIHFAPETAVVPFLKAATPDYSSADIRKGRADLELNLEHIDLPSDSVDTIVCIHVMEHVNDRLALAEFFRVLRPGGRALLMVPIVEGWEESYENDTVTTEKDRILHYGQFDHIRMYGADFRQRILDGGFRIEECTAKEPDVAKYGLLRGEKLFIATKP